MVLSIKYYYYLCGRLGYSAQQAVALFALS